jgi:hypothetical protein
MNKLVLTAALAAAPFSVNAQTAAPMDAVASTVAVQPQLILPANTEIAVTPNDDVTSKGIKVGHTFVISTLNDTMYNGYVVIPKGTPGQAKVAWRTGKGAFGKSAKIEVTFESLTLAGRMIALMGKHRQEGQGNTGATLGTVAVAGLVGGVFITGKSAKIPHGMQMLARTAEPVGIVVPAGATAVPSAALAPTTPGAAPAAPATVPVTK